MKSLSKKKIILNTLQQQLKTEKKIFFPTKSREELNKKYTAPIRSLSVTKYTLHVNAYKNIYISFFYSLNRTNIYKMFHNVNIESTQMYAR